MASLRKPLCFAKSLQQQTKEPWIILCNIHLENCLITSSLRYKFLIEFPKQYVTKKIADAIYEIFAPTPKHRHR